MATLGTPEEEETAAAESVLEGTAAVAVEPHGRVGAQLVLGVPAVASLLTHGAASAVTSVPVAVSAAEIAVGKAMPAAAAVEEVTPAAVAAAAAAEVENRGACMLEGPRIKSQQVLAGAGAGAGAGPRRGGRRRR